LYSPTRQLKYKFVLVAIYVMRPVNHILPDTVQFVEAWITALYRYIGTNTERKLTKQAPAEMNKPTLMTKPEVRNYATELPLIEITKQAWVNVTVIVYYTTFKLKRIYEMNVFLIRIIMLMNIN